MNEKVVWLAENLAHHAQTRIAEGAFGVAGGVVTGDGELELFEGPAEETEDATRAKAWEQVQAWVDESAGVAGGVVLGIEPEPGEATVYEVQVEARDGSTMVFFHPYRRKRLRGGWDFSAGRVYTEPDTRHLHFS